jgi:hypothetical protein
VIRHEGDVEMGPALELVVEGEELTIAGRRVISFSAWAREAYVDPGDHVPGTGLQVWSLSPEQVAHLLERVPGLRLFAECQRYDKVAPAA